MLQITGLKKVFNPGTINEKVALKGVEPMLVSPMRAEPIEPFDRSTTAATPTTAQSWARRLNFL